MRSQRNKTRSICYAALTAALYVVLTLVSAQLGLASGPLQFRLSEILCVLPVYVSSAVPGLAVGCFISNLITASPVWDIVFGTMATALGAVGTYLLRKYKKVATLPPVLANTLIIPLVVRYAYRTTEHTLPYIALGVFAGETVCCVIGGILLEYALEPIKNRLFK